MNSRSYFLRRVLWSVFVLWLVMTATFLLFVVVPDFNLDVAQFGIMDHDKQVEVYNEYREQFHYDEPLLERYFHWMEAYATLQWGTSFAQERPVAEIIGEAAPVTVGYLLPAGILATLFGVFQGMHSSVRRFGLLRRLGNAITYTGLAFPAFWLGEMLLFLALRRYELGVQFDPSQGVLTPHNLGALVLPALVMALNLGAVYARYTRAEASRYLSKDFVKTIRANGGRDRDVARHTFRNAMPPLVSMFFTRALTVFLLSVYAIEYAFGLPGLGEVTLTAIEARDVSVILAMTFITVFVGLIGNLTQDLVYGVVDPRIGASEE